MNFNTAYENWLKICQELQKELVKLNALKITPVDYGYEVDHNCEADYDNLPPSIAEYIRQNDEFVKRWNNALTEHCAYYGHRMVNAETALSLAEKEARLLMHQFTNQTPYSEFYGDSMALVDVIKNDVSGHWNWLVNEVNKYRQNGFTVEVKYCAFNGNSKHYDNSWSAYYLYVNINDIGKFNCAYSCWSEGESQSNRKDDNRKDSNSDSKADSRKGNKDSGFIAMVYPRVAPIDNTHKAIYIEKVEL